jgi:thioredoxin reductase
VYLSRYAQNVTLLVRGRSLSSNMSKYLIDQIAQAPNIHVRPCTQVTAVHGAMLCDGKTSRGASASMLSPHPFIRPVRTRLLNVSSGPSGENVSTTSSC